VLPTFAGRGQNHRQSRPNPGTGAMKRRSWRAARCRRSSTQRSLGPHAYSKSISWTHKHATHTSQPHTKAKRPEVLQHESFHPAPPSQPTQPSHQTPHRIKVSVSMVVGQPGSEVTVMPGRWGRVGGNFRWEGLPLLWGSLVSFQFQLSGSSAQQQHTRALGDFWHSLYVCGYPAKRVAMIGAS